MAISRLIDVHPLEDLKLRLKTFQKLSFKCQFICELIAPTIPIEENEKPKPVEDEKKEEPLNQEG